MYVVPIRVFFYFLFFLSYTYLCFEIQGLQDKAMGHLLVKQEVVHPVHNIYVFVNELCVRLLLLHSFYTSIAKITLLRV